MPTQASATPVVGALVVVGVVAALGALALEGPLPAPDASGLAFALAYSAIFFAAQRSGFRLLWRGHSTRISMEEFALIGGVILLPTGLLLASVVLSTIANQIALRRRAQKAVFNVAQYTFAASLAAASYVLLRQAGLSSMWSAVPTPFLFSFASQGAMAVLFARLEGVGVVRVFRDRFLVWSLVAGFAGISLGMSAYALWTVAPIAVLAILPVFVLLARFGRLAQWAEEEARLHQALAATITRVAQTGDLDEGMHAIADTTADLLSAGEVRVRVPVRPAENGTWGWSHAEGGSLAGIRAPIPTGDGEAGEIEAFPRTGRPAFGPRQQHLLGLIAASAGAAARTHAAALAAKESNRRLMNANRELEEFTLWTTHDMREPLRSVAQLAQILREDVGRLTPEESAELAEKIHKGAEGLKDRIKALHEFSRVVQQDIPFETVELASVVDDALSGLAARIDESRAVIEVPRDLPSVRAQPARLVKVFANLVENALKYNDKSVPRIELSWRDLGEELELCVRDNGPGVEPAMRDKVFQLFQRGTAAHGSGSGAGLAIVKRIVEQHGGRVWITGTPGVGADFCFTLPKADALTLAPTATSPRPVPVTGA